MPDFGKDEPDDDDLSRHYIMEEARLAFLEAWGLHPQPVTVGSEQSWGGTVEIKPEQVIDLTDASTFRYVEIHTPGGIVRVNVGLQSVGERHARVLVEAEPNKVSDRKTAPGGHWDSQVRTRHDGRAEIALTSQPGKKPWRGVSPSHVVIDETNRITHKEGDGDAPVPDQSD